MPIIDDPGDVVIQADAQGDGVGRVVLRAGSHEHTIFPDGTGSGVFGGSLAASLKPSAKLPTRAQPTMLTTFQTGHGWTNVGGTAVNLNDTTAGNYLFGSQGVSITTLGGGAAATIKNFALASTDFSASTTVVWLKVDDITHLKQIDLYWGDTSLTNYYYTLFIDNTLAAGPPIRSGEWVGVRIPRDTTGPHGTPNFGAVTAMQIRVLDDSAGAVTVHYGGIGRIPDPTAFANGCVSLTFDDGKISQFTQARLKMDQYGYGGTAYVIVDLVTGNDANTMSLSQLTELQDKHGWEIAAHAYTLADHNANFTTLTSAALDADVWQLKKWLVDNHFRGHNHFAYPGGAWNLATEADLESYFATVRLLNTTPPQALPPETRPVVRLQAFELLNTTTLAAVEALVDAAYANKTWLVLVFHSIVTSPSASTEWSIANFGSLIDYIATKGIPVKTIGDVLASL